MSTKGENKNKLANLSNTVTISSLPQINYDEYMYGWELKLKHI